MPLADDNPRQACFSKAIKFLKTRMHSREELRRKLQRAHHDRSVIVAVLDDLTRMKYLDDRRFAADKAELLARRKHHGRRRAALELFKSGVSGETSRRALEDVYDSHDSMAVARELARKKLPSLQRLDPRTARRRLYGLLLRRGFIYDEIRPVVDEALGEESRDPSWPC